MSLEGTMSPPQATVPVLATPHCYNMEELADASSARVQTSEILTLIRQNQALSQIQIEFQKTPLFTHLSLGLALTTGSALGCIPPTTEECLAPFQVPNKVGLTAGARAWTKHAHRSQQYHPSAVTKNNKGEAGWWGHAQGPRNILNEGAKVLFWRIVKTASWRNLHMLPHNILAYEMRVPEGYGMRWSRALESTIGNEEEEQFPKEAGAMEGGSVGSASSDNKPWIFRGFVEPMIENGHEVGWRHEVTRTSTTNLNHSKEASSVEMSAEE